MLENNLRVGGLLNIKVVTFKTARHMQLLMSLLFLCYKSFSLKHLMRVLFFKLGLLICTMVCSKHGKFYYHYERLVYPGLGGFTLVSR